MKPSMFNYVAPETLSEVLSVLAAGDARPLAGGQSLIPMLSLRLASVDRLVDLRRVESLRGIRHEGDHLYIGAMTPYVDLMRSTTVASYAPLVAEATRYIGHPAIRTRGTLGGSIAHADPSAELPAVCRALSAAFKIQKTDGTRMVSADEFFIGPMTSILQPGELITEVRVPCEGLNEGSAIAEISRRHGDFALAGAVCSLRMETNMIDRATVVALGGVSVPQMLTGAGKMLVGMTLDQRTITAAAELAHSEVDVYGDLHASELVRRNIVKRCVAAALTEVGTKMEGREVD